MQPDVQKNHICSNKAEDSRCVERVAFAMQKALMVSAMSAGMKVWPCSICSPKCNILTSAPSGFLGNIICPRMASSKASTRV